MGLLFLLCTLASESLGLLLCYEVGVGLNLLLVWYIKSMPSTPLYELMPTIIPSQTHWDTWGTMTFPLAGTTTINILGFVMIALYLLLAIYAISRRVVKRYAHRMHLDHLSRQQRTLIQHIYEASISPTVAKHLRYPRPRRILYRPGPRFYRIYWSGARDLVIDGGLLVSTHENPSLQPLLLHAIGHYNSSDIWLRWVLSLLPPFGSGSIIMGALWYWYWRQRVLAADRFVVWLGHAAVLAQTLDHTLRPLEQPKHRLWRDEPYIDQRLEAIDRYRATIENTIAH